MNEMNYDTSNIVDFTVAKLEKMRGEASNIAWFEMVEQIDVALALYNEGKATIKWVDGEPLITVKEKTNEDNEEQA